MPTNNNDTKRPQTYILVFVEWADSNVTASKQVYVPVDNSLIPIRWLNDHAKEWIENEYGNAVLKLTIEPNK